MGKGHHHHHHHHKEKDAGGVYTGNSEQTPLIESGESGIKSKLTRKNITFAVLFLIVLAAAAVGAVFLTLPQTYTCVPTDASYYIKAVDKPTIESARPPLVCAANPTRIAFVGKSFITQDNGAVQPEVEVSFTDIWVTPDEVTIEEINGTECNSLHLRRRDFQTCRELEVTMTFPTHIFEMEYEATIKVTNPPGPKPALGSMMDTECTSEDFVVKVAPSPVVQDFSPGFLCAGGENYATIIGGYFLQSLKTGASEYKAPKVSVCGGPEVDSFAYMCEDMSAVPGFDSVQSCAYVSAEIDASSCTEGDFVTIDLVNPEPGECPADSSSLSVPVTNPPAINDFSGLTVCSASEDTTVLLTGSGFVKIEGEEPSVYIDGTLSESVTASDCVDYTAGSASLSFCQGLSVKIPTTTDNTLRAVDLAIAGGGMGYTCASTFSEAVYYVPKPEVTSVSPSVLCYNAGEAQTVTLQGTFVAENQWSFGVSLSDTLESPNVMADDCYETAVGQKTFVTCSKLIFEVPAGAEAGAYALTVNGPCATVLSRDMFAIVPAPTVTGLSQNTLCSASSNTVTVSGANFVSYTPNGATTAVVPTVTLSDGSTATDVTVSDCTGDSVYSLCSTLTFTVNGATITSDSVNLFIANSEAKCGSSVVFATMPVAGLPVVTSHNTQICEGADGIIEVTGSNIRSDAIELLLQTTDTQTSYSAVISEASETGFTATFPAGSIPAGTYVTIIRSAPQSACVAANTRPTTVNANELLVLAAVPAVLVPADTRSQPVTVTVRALTAFPETLTLKSTSQTLTYTSENITVANNDYTNLHIKLHTTVASGETFDISVRAVSTCLTEEKSAIRVANGVTGTITSVSPGTASADTETVLTITVSSSDSFTAEDVLSVVAVPAAETDVNEYVLTDVRYIDGTSVSARVKAGLLASGKYGLRVAKASTGNVWSTDVAFQVSGYSLPEITLVKPTLVSADATLTVTGSNFHLDAQYTANIVCASSGTFTASSVNALTTEKLEVKVGAGILNVENEHCKLVLNDNSNGFEMVYNGIVVANSESRREWATAKLPEVLCGASAVSARVGERVFAYVIGGDTTESCTGASPTAKTYFGELGADGQVPTLTEWSEASPLPRATVFGQAQLLGTYIYLVGGFSGNAAYDTVLRAQVLQPTDSPQNVTGKLSAQTSSKLAAGHYIYTVTAVYGTDDDINPGGESLASAEISLHVPKDTGVAVLTWNKLDDATVSTYRVYRANAADAEFGLLTEVTTNSFSDTGAYTPDTTTTPPVIGSIGKWKTLSYKMTTPRAGHAFTGYSTDDDTMKYMFVLGGSAGNPITGTTLASYETASISAAAAVTGKSRETHTVRMWSIGTKDMTPAQRFAQAFMLDHSNIGYTGGIDAIVITPGVDDITAHQVNYVQNNDNLHEFVASAFTEFGTYGHCAFVRDSTLLVAGGSSDVSTPKPSANAYIMKLNTNETTPPTPLTTYYSTVSNLIDGVYYPACTQFGGYSVVIGGVDDEGKSVKFVQYIAA